MILSINNCVLLINNRSSWTPQFSDIYKLLSNKNWLLYSGEHDPVPAFCHQIQNEFLFCFVIKWVYEKHKLLQFLFAFTVSQLF